MKYLMALVLSTVFLVGLGECVDLQVGATVGSQLVYTEHVNLASIPLTTRTKNVFFSSETNQAIRGISAIDLDKSAAKPIVTAGGVGSTYINVRIKSERGDGLNYQVQIFT